MVIGTCAPIHANTIVKHGLLIASFPPLITHR
jgi:hypothetical protein